MRRMRRMRRVEPARTRLGAAVDPPRPLPPGSEKPS
jgi:hypothetical protein